MVGYQFLIPQFKLDPRVATCPDVGPEVHTGSRRMKSGTLKKLVCKMITTAAMVKHGKVYEKMMVDLHINSRTLEERPKRIAITVSASTYLDAERYLQAANGHVKTALLMILKNINADVARKRLKEASRFEWDGRRSSLSFYVSKPYSKIDLQTKSVVSARAGAPLSLW